ncbi:MAG TPA: hypothetical protein DCS07_08735 [Bdellovibrionales bacterium]|nr:MAG: hypothetical protein A2Z97_02790 [Bdellovibrionales bacterium GWB1_52_6]OFZ05823.1 MAG: hypothetical protein A2X97_03940 [Bdellovibrionales bacterium GWA1_52_35]OFZ39332.1 MAG: hypothetical protein A2070_03620 [Bdellovibrionales bacterium GWC1_52_8]HAR42695.1 hypothetical protein [Bdellovibrionales bacterium]HCM40232.1 hypothetical protein [Bdellovibrionales bacterium]
MSSSPQQLISNLSGFFDLSIDRRTLVANILKTISDFTGYEKTAIYLPDASPEPPADAGIPARVEQIDAYSIPLQSPRGKVVGVLEIQNWNGKTGQDGNLPLLELLAQFAALALEYRLETPSGSANPKVADVISLDLRRAKENLEKGLIDRALLQTRGNKSQAAKLLGITREGLRKAMKKVA